MDHDDPVAALVAHLNARGFDPRETGPDSWESICPSHEGSRRNLSIARGDDNRALIFCHHSPGCSHRDIVAALGMTETDLFPLDPNRPARPATTGKPKARSFPTVKAAADAMTFKLGTPHAWLYTDANGEGRMAVCRFDGPNGKTYRPLRKTPAGWEWGDPPGPLLLYYMPNLATADRIFVTEGEKTTDLAVNLGVTATTSAHGAKSAAKSDWSPLAGKEIVILPDHDEPGEIYAGKLVGLLAGLRPQPVVRVVRLADIWRTDAPMPEGGDIEEWLSLGVPEDWTAEQRRAELERVANLAPAEDLPAPVAAEPKGDDEPDDAWPPIRLGTLPPVAAFPLDVLPEPARRLAIAGSGAISCPVDFLAVATLATASALIGRSASLLVKPGYFQSALLYVALVGGPSSGKSPALRAALRPLWGIAETLYSQWKPVHGDWEATPKEARGDEPTLRRIVTTDSTTEALGPLLASNPRGLLVAPDEMTKWVLSMDQYRGGKGGDRPFWLSNWNGEPLYIDRAKHMKEPIIVPHPFISVAGGMTPDMLSALPEGKGRDDGFLSRLLFTYPDRESRHYSEAGIPEATADDWHALALALWNRPMRDYECKPAPHVATMSPEARREWVAWNHAHYAEQEADEFPDHLEGPWGKLEAYTARLALILHMMHLASDPTRPADDLPTLPRRTIEDAARLAAYFKGHARRVYGAMGGKCDGGGEHVKALVKWILRNDKTRFSERDIGRDFDRFDPANLAGTLAWMTAHNLIRPRSEPEATPRPGRKRSPTYEVNPTLRDAPRFRQFRQNSGPSLDSVGIVGNAVGIQTEANDREVFEL